jgi:signal recognition particle GTPase
VLGRQAEVATLPIVAGQPPVDIAKRAMMAARLEGMDVLLLDTAGRLAIDEALMAEVAAVRDATQPHETLLVADSMTGQDAVNVNSWLHLSKRRYCSAAFLPGANVVTVLTSAPPIARLARK